jgi:ataxia telangiectasia mutated family protein
VYRLLVSDASNAFSHPLQPILSNYFQTIIKSSNTDTKVLQVVLNIVLHLRHFPQAPKKGPLSYDKWLNLDFSALCDASMRCGAYTTALLFLELANEYSTEAQVQDNPDTEDILYEIYRHIDEPDGFYAINSNDIRKQLSNKFQHESKWESAFQLHVSQYESSHISSSSDSTTPSNVQGIIDSLYAFGFNHLAVSLARNIPAKSSSGLDYSLAWRTEVWDLPEPTSREDHGAVIYNVLRTVHKGRNIHKTRDLCDITVRREIQRLKDINAENVAEIRRSIQIILALREVQMWVKREQEAQDELSQPVWMDEFAKLSSDFE